MASTRIVLTDGSGRYFYEDKATIYEEGTRWNGNNHISLHTGSQWDHEKLIRTAGGTWILNRWSQWQGSQETYEETTDEEAAVWLSIAGEHRALSKYFPEESDGLEIK